MQVDLKAPIARMQIPLLQSIATKTPRPHLKQLVLFKKKKKWKQDKPIKQQDSIHANDYAHGDDNKEETFEEFQAYFS